MDGQTEALAVVDDSTVAKVNQLSATYGGLAVTNLEDMKQATDTREIIASMQRGIRTAWKELVTPFKVKVKKIDDGYKPLLDRLEAVDDHLKAEMLSFRQREIVRQREEARLAEVENDRRRQKAEADAQAERERVAAETMQKATAAGFTATEAVELTTLEVSDVKAQVVAAVEAPAPIPTKIYSDLGASQIARVVDRAKISAAVEQGVREIPGVRIYQVWNYEIIEAKSVPDEYRMDSLRRA